MLLSPFKKRSGDEVDEDCLSICDDAGISASLQPLQLVQRKQLREQSLLRDVCGKYAVPRQVHGES